MMDMCNWYDWTRFIPISVCGVVIISVHIYLAWQRHKSIKEFEDEWEGG